MQELVITINSASLRSGQVEVSDEYIKRLFKGTYRQTYAVTLEPNTQICFQEEADHQDVVSDLL